MNSASNALQDLGLIGRVRKIRLEALVKVCVGVIADFSTGLVLTVPLDQGFPGVTGLQIDPALKARMQQSRDPGETLIEWHREQKTRAEVGGDLTAYTQRLREEALKDPEFRKAAMEAWRTDAQPQNNGRPRVDLPPSLNGASRSNALLRSQDSDVSDTDLWNEITA